MRQSGGCAFGLRRRWWGKDGVQTTLELIVVCQQPAMDPESAAFQPRDDIWRMQDDMLRIHQTQAELSDRVSRLERRNEDDSHLKNVWGGASPFPSVLGGTPQQGATLFQSHVVFEYRCAPPISGHIGRPKRPQTWSYLKRTVLMCYSSLTTTDRRPVQQLR